MIYALPFTAIIEQTSAIFEDIFKGSGIDIFQIHHKSSIDETLDLDRYSEIKFLMNSFSGEINITTFYQLIFAIFGNANQDNLKFNQLKNSVIIVDEVQAIPYELRADFLEACEIISRKFGTIFILMSATMPIVGDSFIELSNLEYFREQNRYEIEYLPLKSQDDLEENIEKFAKDKNTLCVVNSVAKSQELFLKFKDKFNCYCLNGYMRDFDKERVIKTVSEKLKSGSEKVLLISTQSIEAGVDLDFEVGFREIAPISSIIQSAGRVNREFKRGVSKLFVFDSVSENENLIYGMLLSVSRELLNEIRDKSLKESELFGLSERYFQKINRQLESYLFEENMQLLEFETINKKLLNLMGDNEPKELVIIEPFEGFIKELEDELFSIQSESIDRFKKRDKTQALVKKMLPFGVNIYSSDILKFKTNLEEIKLLKNIFYLPFGTVDYDEDFGVVKFREEESNLVFD